MKVEFQTGFLAKHWDDPEARRLAEFLTKLGGAVAKLENIAAAARRLRADQHNVHAWEALFQALDDVEKARADIWGEK